MHGGHPMNCFTGWCHLSVRQRFFVNQRKSQPMHWTFSMLVNVAKWVEHQAAANPTARHFLLLISEEVSTQQEKNEWATSASLQDGEKRKLCFKCKKKKRGVGMDGIVSNFLTLCHSSYSNKVAFMRNISWSSFRAQQLASRYEHKSWHCSSSQHCGCIPHSCTCLWKNLFELELKKTEETLDVEDFAWGNRRRVI